MTSINNEKRKKIMGRSILIGHCVCDPRKPCPCDIFKEKNICECAGEKIPINYNGNIKLTELVKNAGCASKIGKKDLITLLSNLPGIEDPRVLIGSSAGDDAGVIMLSDETALVLTVDVFSPVVDDPYTFGMIAAANSLSDIYAMGAKPMTALSIIGFPAHSIPLEEMNKMLKGGIDKMKEAGISIIGGHSINDAEIKLGFAIIGTITKEDIIKNSGAKLGDAIVLTKPIGTGIISFANQVGRTKDESLKQITNSMLALNKTAGLLMKDFNASAATDITGFSLLGHMSEIVKNSKIEVEINFDQIPFFSGLKELACQDVIPGAVERNREAVDEKILDFTDLSQPQINVLFSPETSGGLLVFLPNEKAPLFLEKLKSEGIMQSEIIGRVTNINETGKIVVKTATKDNWLNIAFSGNTVKKEPAVSINNCCCCKDDQKKIS